MRNGSSARGRRAMLAHWTLLATLLVGAAGPSTAAANQTATYVLSGGASADDRVEVDDDLDVYLNGQLVFRDDNVRADALPPIRFSASPGDEIRIVAEDSFGVCRGLSDDLSLHRVDTGEVQLLTGYQDACGGAGEGSVFYDRTFVIGAGGSEVYAHRFLQFNMCGSAGGPPSSKPNSRCAPEGVADAVARTIREFHPTVVSLNEVCRSQLDRVLYLLTADFALSPKDQGPWAMTAEFAVTNAKKNRCSDRQFGTAVLVRGPVEQDPGSPYPLDRGPGGKGKARGGAESRVMVCLTSVATSVPLHACSVHVTAKPRNDTRDQIFEVARIGLSWVSQGHAAVIGGDFNATPEALSAYEDEEVSGGLSRFLQEYADVDFADDEATHETYGKIDYIFVSLRHFTDLEGDATSSEYSDHHPLRGSATFVGTLVT